MTGHDCAGFPACYVCYMAWLSRSDWPAFRFDNPPARPASEEQAMNTQEARELSASMGQAISGADRRANPCHYDQDQVAMPVVSPLMATAGGVEAAAMRCEKSAHALIAKLSPLMTGQPIRGDDKVRPGGSCESIERLLCALDVIHRIDDLLNDAARRMQL